VSVPLDTADSHREITHSDSHSIPLTTDKMIAWRQGSGILDDIEIVELDPGIATETAALVKERECY
jgi:hypothetical protein